MGNSLKAAKDTGPSAGLCSCPMDPFCSFLKHTTQVCSTHPRSRPRDFGLHQRSVIVKFNVDFGCSLTDVSGPCSKQRWWETPEYSRYENPALITNTGSPQQRQCQDLRPMSVWWSQNSECGQTWVPQAPWGFQEMGKPGASDAVGKQACSHPTVVRLRWCRLPILFD